jgi:hypothetical protein
MDTACQKILLLILFLSPVLAVFVVLKILQIQKWKRTQEILSGMAKSEYISFENIRFQITNYYYIKSIIGTPQTGCLYINSTDLIIINRKKPFLLNITSTLPLKISNNNSRNSIKICTWKAVLLTLKSPSIGIGFHQT